MLLRYVLRPLRAPEDGRPGGGRDPEARLRIWLRDTAGVHEKALGKTVLALEAQDVYDVADLSLLLDLPVFDDGIAALSLHSSRSSSRVWHSLQYAHSMHAPQLSGQVVQQVVRPALC